MSYQPFLDDLNPKLEEVVNSFQEDIIQMRAGSISPALIQDIKIEFFGSQMQIKQLGSIAMSGREIFIQLWDQTYTDAVVKTIRDRDMGLGIRVDGAHVFLSAPPLTEDSKKALVKTLNHRKEESFQIIRGIRDKVWKAIQDAERSGELPEDDKFRGKDKMEEMVKKYREKIEEMAERKKNEIEQ